MGVAKKNMMSAYVINKKMERLALEIIENNIEERELFFVGIESKGVVLAKKIKKLTEANSAIKVHLLTLLLDKQNPSTVELNEEVNFTGKVVIVIDDVTNSGKTLLYAMKPFLAYHPKKIQTLVLVERSHTQFPISPDYKGLSLATTLQEHITVEVEGDKITGAFLN